MGDNISIFTITNNIYRRRPREPLVQIIAYRDSEHNGIILSPIEAIKVAKEIIKSAKAAAKGCKRSEVFLELGDLP